MRQLDELVDAWVRSVATSEPHLVPHLDEIADHLRTDARERVRSGSDLPSAFAASVGALGAPRALAHDFAATEHRWERRLTTRFALATIIGTLVVTSAVVAIDKLVHPLDPRWFAFLYLPVLFVSNLVFIGRFRRRARAREGTARAR